MSKTTWRAARAPGAVIALILASAGAVACGAPPPPQTPTATPAVVADWGVAVVAIGRELDDFHDAAAHADEARYFAHLADDAVFLGTDATERWDVAAFRTFAHPYFAKGKAWSFHATRRAITVSEDGHFAYFDEDLATEDLGPARGSGVLALHGGAWKIAQYNLAVVVPNERFAELRALLSHPAPPKVEPFEARNKAAYQRATEAAARGDLAAGERELSALVDEALAREGDDAAFWLHNELTWLRWGEGDLVGALGEVDGAKSALLRARLPEKDSARIGLHEKWDRAYLLLELAGEAPPTLRAKALAAANEARADVRESRRASRRPRRDGRSGRLFRDARGGCEGGAGGREEGGRREGRGPAGHLRPRARVRGRRRSRACGGAPEQNSRREGVLDEAADREADGGRPRPHAPASATESDAMRRSAYGTVGRRSRWLA